MEQKAYLGRLSRGDFHAQRPLIRVSKYRGDPHATSYIVAIAEPAKAMELIQAQASVPGDDVEDLGRVSDSLLTVLKLGTGQFIPI